MKPDEIREVLKTIWGVWILGLITFAVINRFISYQITIKFHTVAAITSLLLVSTAIYYYGK